MHETRAEIRTTTALTSTSWREMMAAYARPSTRRGVIQILNTGLPFLALVGALLYGLDRGVWPALALIVPAAALLVRLFAIQHDCGHGSFFKARWANDWLGRLIGVLTLTPYVYWRNNHAAHHASSGNLDRRGVGDIDTLTVREYAARSRLGRLAYRLYRHPLVMFGIGPVYIFFIRHRIPSGHPLRDRHVWLSVLGTNAAIAAIVLALAAWVGPTPLLLGYGPVALLGAMTGVWLFYIQHQFEDAYWVRAKEWSFRAAALEGCSFYDLPRMMHWFTGHIGLHHIHHLSSRIPNYRLRECFEQNAELRRAKRLTLLSSLRCASLALWDEERRKLVSFRAARRS